MWSPSFRKPSRAFWRPRSPTRPRPGVMGPRTAALTFAVLRLLTPRAVPGALKQSAANGLALATLGGATLRLVRFRLAKQLRGRKRLGWRAGRALQEPLEAALAVVMVGALALPLLVVPGPGRTARPGQEPPPRHEGCVSGGSERSAQNGGDDGDDLGLEGAIASW